MDCNIGDIDLLYDAESRKLIWRTMNDKIVALKFAVKHKISLNITRPYRKVKIDKEIDASMLHENRMYSRDEDILGLNSNYTLGDLKKSKKVFSLVYHPDKFNILDDYLKTILNRRMQEANVSCDRLGKNIRR